VIERCEAIILNQEINENNAKLITSKSEGHAHEGVAKSTMPIPTRFALFKSSSGKYVLHHGKYGVDMQKSIATIYPSVWSQLKRKLV
jgi:hypothetical protein